MTDPEPKNPTAQVQAPSWVGRDRRDPAHTSARIQLAVNEAMAEHEEKVKAHMDARFDQLTKIVVSAFPGDDPVGHRQYHQKQIDYMNERMALWKDIRSKSVTGIVWLLLGLLGTALWEYFKLEVRK